MQEAGDTLLEKTCHILNYQFTYRIFISEGRNGLTVTNGGNAVYQAPPYVLYTKSEVKISLKGEELVFPGLTIPSVEGTVTSSLTAIDILAMTTKCYWDTLWINFVHMN